MIENKGIYFGANITGFDGWGPSSTGLVCESLGEGSPYCMLSEIDHTGAIVRGDNGQYNRIYIQDLGEKGARIFKTEGPNPALPPNTIETIQVGSLYAVITATTSEYITFNRTPLQIADRSVYDLRYPSEPSKI